MSRLARCTVFVVSFLSFYRNLVFFFFTEKYFDYFTTPYFIFFRDTLSYLTLLGLHFAICLSPSTLAFSRLEWVILVFFLGRIVTEFDQFMGGSKAGRKERQSCQRSLHGSNYEVCSTADQQSARTSSDENVGLKRFANYFRYVHGVSLIRLINVGSAFNYGYTYQITLEILTTSANLPQSGLTMNCK